MTTWRQSFYALLHPRVITMLFFGLSAGIPLLLIFSSLGLWLREAGVERTAEHFLVGRHWDIHLSSFGHQ